MPLLAGRPPVSSSDTMPMVGHQTPWRFITDDGLFVGHDRSVWLYMKMPLEPLYFADNSVLLASGNRWMRLQRELGQTSPIPLGHSEYMAEYRAVHIVSMIVEESFVPPDWSTPEHIQRWLRPALGDQPLPVKRCFIGVKLFASAGAAATRLNQALAAGAPAFAQGRLLQGLRDTRQGFRELFLPKLIDIDLYHADLVAVSRILQSNGALPLQGTDVDYLCAWYNRGGWSDQVFLSDPENPAILVVPRGPGVTETLEMAALVKFEETVMPTPITPWVDAAMSDPEQGAIIVSIRGEFEPALMLKGQLRKQQKRIMNEIAAEMKMQDLPDDEKDARLQLQQEIRSTLNSDADPALVNVSIVFGRFNPDPEGPGDYISNLEKSYGIRVKPLEYRQLDAITHTLPCGDAVNLAPATRRGMRQGLMLPVLAYAGINSFSELGDRKGIQVGLCPPEMSPCYIDPLRAASGAANKQTPVVGIIGDPGSGKTWLAQTIAAQAQLLGYPVVFINPKGGAQGAGGQSLGRLLTQVPGRLVNLSDLQQVPGALDPFRYMSSPEQAGQELYSFIETILGNAGQVGAGFDHQDMMQVYTSMIKAAQAGATCGVDVCNAIQPEHVRRAVQDMWTTSAGFRLAIGQQRGAAGAGQVLQATASGRQLLLIEFGRDLNLPPAGTPVAAMGHAQRLATAILQLITVISREILLTAGAGGVMIVDEAYAFLASPQARQMADVMGRQGRSQRILPIFLTHAVADLADMENYFGRVFVMGLNKEREAKAAVALCGLPVTPERVHTVQYELTPIAPDNPEGRPPRPAQALHNDLDGRTSLIIVGPTPDPWPQTFSTSLGARPTAA